MRKVLVTARVDVHADRDERRDALDQRWPALLLEAGLMPVALGNRPEWAAAWLVNNPLEGLLLTGGNNLMAHGGDAPERDATERLLLEAALMAGAPVLGVCRGMQLIMDHYGCGLKKVAGHVTRSQVVLTDSGPQVVNSFHELGAVEAPAEFEVWARAEDGVVKAIKHQARPVWGIMWHPERISPFRDEDIDLLRRVFGERSDR